jgi:murein DD-endopeptidase MepM/ murein hydrolase activator NlpD
MPGEKQGHRRATRGLRGLALGVGGALIALLLWGTSTPAHGSGTSGGLPTISPSPLPSILPSPLSTGGSGGGSGGGTGGSSGGSGGSGGGSGGSGGGGSVLGSGTGGSGTGGSSGGSGSTSRSGQTTTQMNRAARRHLGEGTKGCIQSPSRSLMLALAAQEPAPTFVRSEPSGMSGPQNTDQLARVLKGFAQRRHLSMRQAFLRVAGPFPLAGPAAWSDDWHAYRPCPYPHLHEGLDMFAPRGTPAVAVQNGVIDEKGSDSISGNYVELTDRHGTQYFYCHFESFPPDLHQGMHVHRGQVVGFVGNTGDASGGPTHLHFQVEPNGTPSPPKPFVDAWLLDSIQRARILAGLAPRSSDSKAVRRPAGSGPGIALRPSAQPASVGDAQAPEAVAAQPSSTEGTVLFDLILALAAIAVIGGMLAIGIGVRRLSASRASRSRRRAQVQRPVG